MSDRHRYAPKHLRIDIGIALRQVFQKPIEPVAQRTQKCAQRLERAFPSRDGDSCGAHDRSHSFLVAPGYIVSLHLVAIDTFYTQP